ncbi:unconventional prefoldin RPB5 interactor-like protein isoform X2 [Apis laboriosa]|uniref:unconventional prefoldin RPB5 interactor-like protein isoform X2 n=1 Tax=Apis laboriosa TaxID=183418 RepID=UPI001CC650AB|nr:unconventional prefoldin RPB5 interactor-like protein isoform X2 [Apis laboriosa]
MCTSGRSSHKTLFFKGIQRNEEQCKIWIAYKKNHQKVAETLQIFQKDLYVNCMIPIGKRALMKGKLIHTNEILTSLGDGYFAKYSASGAIALCKRRVQRAEEMLNNLNAERDLYETRMMMLESNLFDDFAGGEIIEHWNENQITEWKKKHREREREYHQKLVKLKQEERKKIETEEDLFNRLDQLEIEEELADELNRLEDYEHFEKELQDGECYYESESSSESEKEESFKKEEKQVLNSDTKQSKDSVEVYKIKKFVSFVEPEDISNKEENSIKEKEKNDKSMVDMEDFFRIEFSHSENFVLKSKGNLIETPADIYRIFSKPKSILKRSLNDMNPEQLVPQYSMEKEEEKEEEQEEEEEEEEEEEIIQSSAYEIVVKDIKERSITEVTNEILRKKEENKNIRPISKFKRDRQLKQQ